MKLFSLSLVPLGVLLLQAVTGPLQPRPQGSIEGMVTRVGTGQPVPAARVTLTRRGGPAQTPLAAPVMVQGVPAQAIPAGARGAPPAPIPSVVTDDKGRFIFQALEEGTYAVQVQANGYAVQSYGQRYANGPGTPIPMTAGQTVKNVNVGLMPASNISGRIRDRSDQPLINIPVQLLRYSYDSTGQRQYQSVGMTQTNDRGEYRMYWVTPGRYYLLVGRSSPSGNPLETLFMMASGAGGPNGNEVPAVLGYAYYPGETEIGNARALDLQPGADLQGIDLALNPRPRTYTIRGRLLDSRTGQPPPRANVSAVSQVPGLNSNANQIAGPVMSSRNYDAKTGVFEIRDLLPGTYNVIATVQDVPVPGRGWSPGQSLAMIVVTVLAADLDGITISAVPAVSLPGRLRIDGQLPPNMTIDRLRVRLVPVGANSALQQALQAQLANASLAGPLVAVGSDGSFYLANTVPGEYRVEVLGLGNSLFLKDARFENADILNSPFRFSGTANNALEVALGVAGGRLSGGVTDPRSQPIPSTRVVIVPDRARHRSDLYKVVTTDQNGQFVLSGLPPGDYKVYAWEALEEFAWFDPDVLARYETRGRSVHVTETSSETIDVRIILAEGTR